MSSPRVSVIITTKNEARTIEACIDAIKQQTLPRSAYEIIVVDNASEDATVSLAEPHVDAVYRCGPERSAQRNFGVEKARAPYVLYLDADMRLSPRVLEECLALCADDPTIVGIYIPEIIVGTGYWIAVRNFERHFYTSTCIDAVRFMQRDAFLATGGFDTALCGPEDWDLDRRLLARGRYAVSMVPLYHDEGVFNIRRYLHKKAYYATTFDRYRDKWDNDAIVRKQLGFFYRYIGVFVEKGKWRHVCTHPLRACGMYYLRFRVGLSFLLHRMRGSVRHPYTAGREQ